MHLSAHGLIHLPRRLDSVLDKSSSRLSPGFPVEFGGFGELHAAFFAERRTRGLVQRCVAGNPGPGNG